MNHTVCRTGLRPRTIHPGRNMAGGVATPRPPGPSVTKRRSVVSSPYTISQWRQLHHDTERDSAIAEERQFVSDNTTVVSRNTNIQNGRSMGGGSVMITRDSDDPPRLVAPIAEPQRRAPVTGSDYFHRNPAGTIQSQGGHGHRQSEKANGKPDACARSTHRVLSAQ